MLGMFNLHITLILALLNLLNLPLVLLLGLFAYFVKKGTQGQMGIMEIGKSRARLVGEEVAVTFADVGGCDEAKEQLADLVGFLKDPAAYAAAGVRRFLVDGPALRGDTAFARPVGTSDVVCVGRDLEVTYRVWSPRKGYPGSAEYRDFHTWDHESGLKPARVTGRRVPTERKRPYDPALGAQRGQPCDHGVDEVVGVAGDGAGGERGRPALTVAAFDTELFGHWWHEGPAWLAAVLRRLPEAGVAVRTLGDAVDDGLVGDPVDLRESSWGSGKDWRVWAGPQVADLVARNAEVQSDLLAAPLPGPLRDPLADLLADQALHALSSDWAFMVSKDSAAGYARSRADLHAGRVAELSGLLRAGRRRAAQRRVAAWSDAPLPTFGHVDARDLGRV